MQGVATSSSRTPLYSGRFRRRLAAAAALCGVSLAAAGADLGRDATRCGQSAPVAVQVLGSGGPELSGGRASSGYLLWVDGVARLMVDAGSGSLLRFGQTGAALADLEWLALTHLHVDHAAELPALVKAGYFSSRERALPVSGPSGNQRFPGLIEYLSGLFGEAAPFRYLGGALDGTGGQFELVPVELAAEPGERTVVLSDPRLHVEAIGVRHGPVPAVAYRVSTGGRHVVFSGDHDGRTEGFWGLARGADLLIANMAVPQGARGPALDLHAAPARIGRGAASAGVKHLLLSHLMRRSLAGLDESTARVRAEFNGRVSVADDLMCVPIP